MKRSPDVVIISDLHLGTYGCRAKELLQYLKNIKPKVLVLNGDIIDIWQFKKSYFPPEHLDVVRRILKLAASDTKVYYLTGNHDDLLRHFGEVEFGTVQLRNKLVFQLDGKSHWVFHGDVFDASIKNARWLAKLGGQGYDWLIWLNRTINRARRVLGFRPVSFSADIKKRVKMASKFISDFEQTAIELAGEKGYDYVICGHIHQPQMRQEQTKEGHTVTYLNSGDWIENCTALEFEHGKWRLYKYEEEESDLINKRLHVQTKSKQDFHLMPAEVMLQGMEVAAFEM